MNLDHTKKDIYLTIRSKRMQTLVNNFCSKYGYNQRSIGNNTHLKKIETISESISKDIDLNLDGWNK